MSIVIIRDCATGAELQQMLVEYGDYIKFAVDVERRIIAGGGEAHFDCEQMLLSDGSAQANIWCSGYFPGTGSFTHDSIVNIRPRDGNASTEIQDESLRQLMREIILERIGEACNEYR